MKITKILQLPSVQILLHICKRVETRHSDLAKIIASRGSLSANLKTLENEMLIERRVVPSKPVKTFYALTPKGKEIAIKLTEIEQIYKNK